MKKIIIVLLAMLFAFPAFASNITIYDENGYKAAGQGGEDDETEPGMVNSQVWDLEGFFLDNDALSMVGGFDFKNGVSGYSDYTSGDIFISVGTPIFGDIDGTNGFNTVANSYGFDYVFDLDFGTMTYELLSLDSGSQVKTTYFAANEGSSPWKYVSGGVKVASDLFAYGTIQNSGFSGNKHYSLTGFDLSFLGHGTEFYSHFTMGCGNDNLMGKGTVVPEPATLILLGSGLAGLAFYRRKKK